MTLLQRLTMIPLDFIFDLKTKEEYYHRAASPVFECVRFDSLLVGAWALLFYDHGTSLSRIDNGHLINDPSTHLFLGGMMSVVPISV